MRPTKTKGDCSYCYHLSEEKILTQIGLQAERHNVEVRLQRLTKADDGFNKSLSTIFALASKAHD